MAEIIRTGDIVYLTPAAQDYLSRNRGESFNISVVGRISQVIDVYNWSTAKGKKILKERETTNAHAWKRYNSREYKYVIATYYPELQKPDSEERGLVVPELFCMYHPMAKEKVPLFRKWPQELITSAFALSTEYDLNLLEKMRVSRSPNKQG